MISLDIISFRLQRFFFKKTTLPSGMVGMDIYNVVQEEVDQPIIRSVFKCVSDKAHS